MQKLHYLSRVWSIINMLVLITVDLKLTLYTNRINLFSYAKRGIVGDRESQIMVPQGN